MHQPPMIRDNGPKMGRNMGFPDMKYLDPETQGAPLRQDQTFYKEFQADDDNDIKLRREAYGSNAGKQDLANNTFIKLFQNHQMEGR